jgi:hypothetical protein
MRIINNGIKNNVASKKMASASMKWRGIENGKRNNNENNIAHQTSSKQRGIMAARMAATGSLG